MKFCWPHNCLEVDKLSINWCRISHIHRYAGIPEMFISLRSLSQRWPCPLWPCPEKLHDQPNQTSQLITAWKKAISDMIYYVKTIRATSSSGSFHPWHYWNQIALCSIIMEQKTFGPNSLSCPNNDGNLAAVLFQPVGRSWFPTLKWRTAGIVSNLCQGPNQWVKRAARSNNSSLFCLALEKLIKPKKILKMARNLVGK